MKKSDVRKLVLLIGFSLLAAQVFAGSYYEGTGLEGKCFLAEEPVLSGYTGTTGNALITSLQSEIQNAFPQYTGMKLCTSNSEPADYIIMTVVQQNGNGSFLLTMTIMDPFTEATISCSINNILKENDVYQHALANALLQLVPKLGITLTTEGLSNLRSLSKIPAESTAGTAGTTGKKTTDTNLSKQGTSLGIWGMITWSTGAATGLGFDIGLDAYLSKINFICGIHSIPTVASGSITSIDCGIELSKKIKLFGYKAFPLLSLQLGYGFFTKKNLICLEGFTVNNVPQPEKHGKISNCVTFCLNSGLFIPLSNKASVKTQYSLQKITLGSGSFWQDRFSVGIILFANPVFVREE